MPDGNQIAPTATTQLPAQSAPRTELRIVNDESSFANLLDTARFEHMWRVAKVFAASGMVPKQYENAPEACFVAVQMAVRLEVDPFMFMQNTYRSPDGKPAMYGQLAIALVNSRGPFTGPINFELSGQGDGRACTAWAVDKRSGQRCEVTVSVATAKAEGWYSRNPKWRNMTDQMLRYRSGAWLGRVYAPECLMGLPIAEELEDIGEAQRFERARDVTDAPPRPRRADFAESPADREFREAEERGDVRDATVELINEETGEVTTVDADTPLRDAAFWNGDSYEVKPPTKGKNGTDWKTWRALFDARLGEASVPGEVARLDHDNAKWIGNYTLADNEAGADLRAAIAARAGELQEVE